MGKGKGGGGGSTPHIGIPPALESSGGASLLQNVFNPLGTYGTQLFSTLQSLGNWASNIATGGNVLGTSASLPPNGLLSSVGAQTYSPFTTGAGSGGAGGAFGGNNSLLGPFLSQFQQGISGMEAGTITGSQMLQSGIGQLTGLQNQATADQNQANWLTGKGNRMLTQATTGSGLFPSQQAYINQAEASQQQAVQQQLANEGLGSSTVSAQLQGQVKMSAAAAAGQLIQGNISAANQTIGLGQTATGLAQAQTGLAQEQQKINLAAQEALYSQFQGISQLSGAEQAQMWSEAQQGYGALGQMMNTTLGAFGYSMKTQEDVLQANISEAGLQAGIQQQQAQMAQQGASSMFSALGSLLGQGGSGGSGGLLGGLGGLLGSVGASSPITGTVGGLGVAGGATAGTGLLGAAGGAISSIGSALGALFCEVARTVYGVDSPDWLLFRDWILFRAPKSVRTAYVIHAFRVSRWIKGRPIICRIIKWAMNAVLWYDDKITG